MALIRVRHRFGRRLLFGFLRIELHALALDLLQVAGRRDQRQLARQQIIARVAVGDLHDFAALPDVFDVVSENDFHVMPLVALGLKLWLYSLYA